MKKTIPLHLSIVMGCLLCMAFANRIFAQNQLEFLGAQQTPDQTMILSWQGNSNEIYEIDETDVLTNSPPVWNLLYSDYPSQGTNTIWMDAGNYLLNPQMVSPKFSPARFYRVVVMGTNALTPPVVAVTSVTNGQVLSGTLSVTLEAITTNELTDLLLFVDGQEMNDADSSTNWTDTTGVTNYTVSTFTLNTCEWANGAHNLFAVGKCQSYLPGTPYQGSDVTYGRSASPFVAVTFNNLIEQLAFSQPFFDPTLGQTQQVTAVFASNVNWTLNIEDVNSNIVATTNGSGTSLLYAWDGTSNGVTIPNGIYNYYVSAETNGGGGSGGGGSGGGGSGPPPPGEMISGGGSGSYETVPLPPAPPGMWYGTNEDGSEIKTVNIFVSAENDSGRRFSPDGTGDAPSPPVSEDTQGPIRPPTNPVKGSVGTFGVVYFTFPNGLYANAPATGFPIPPYFVALDGKAANGHVSFGPLSPAKDEAMKFAQYMTKQGWKQSFMLSDGQVNATMLKKASLGGSNLFNTVNIGLFITHGSYGTTYESDFVYYTYLWFPDGSFLHLSDFDFGSSGTNGLRWMAIHACGVLRQNNYTSMKNAGKLPINSNLHLLMGDSTQYTYMYGPVGLGYASGLAGIDGKNQLTVPNAWFNAGTTAYRSIHEANAANFTVVGSDNCFSDTVSSYQATPSGSLQYTDTNVYNP